MPLYLKTSQTRKSKNTPCQNRKTERPSERSIEEIEETHGLQLDDQYYCTAERGNSFTSARIQRAHEQPVRVIREIPHCSGGVSAFRARGALPRPALGRCSTCHEGIHKIASGLGHGVFKT